MRRRRGRRGGGNGRVEGKLGVRVDSGESALWRRRSGRIGGGEGIRVDVR